MTYVIRKIYRICNPKNYLKRVKVFVRFLNIRFLDELWTNQDYILKNIDTFSQKRHRVLASIPQAEHQIGRYTQMKKIADEIVENDVKGDILEFGTWQGLGIILIAKSFGENLGDRRILGIDSFRGLPTSSTVWRKGQFNDTNLEIVKNNVRDLVGAQVNFSLIEGWFDDLQTVDKIHHSTKSVAMVHFDADLGTSTFDALRIVEKFFVNRKSPIFFLFDDWGIHPDEVPDAFLFWLESARSHYNFKETKIGSTKFTRQYRLDFLD